MNLLSSLTSQGWSMQFGKVCAAPSSYNGELTCSVQRREPYSRACQAHVSILPTWARLLLRTKRLLKPRCSASPSLWLLFRMRVFALRSVMLNGQRRGASVFMTSARYDTGLAFVGGQACVRPANGTHKWVPVGLQKSCLRYVAAVADPLALHCSLAKVHSAGHAMVISASRQQGDFYL